MLFDVFKCLVFKQPPNLTLRAVSNILLSDFIQQDILMPQMKTVFRRAPHTTMSLAWCEPRSQQSWRQEKELSGEDYGVIWGLSSVRFF